MSDNTLAQLSAVAGANAHLTEEKRIELRIKCVELGTSIAIAKGKPSHAPYIAADLYQFLLTGQKPEGPDERKAKLAAQIKAGET